MKNKTVAILAVAATSLLAAATLHAEIFFPGPGIDPASNQGYRAVNSGGLPTSPIPLAATGLAAGQMLRVAPATVPQQCVVRWGPNVSTEELLTLTPQFHNGVDMNAGYVSESGMVLGYSSKFSAAGGDLGSRAVVWDANTTAPRELGNLGVSSVGVTNASTYGMDAAGIFVGIADKYSASGALLGRRGVRWLPGINDPVELLPINSSTSGASRSYVYAVNASGTVIGFSDKYQGSTLLGPRPMRWDPGQVTPIELGNLGTPSNVNSDVLPLAINAGGTIIGSIPKYNGNVFQGFRGVRWDSGQTTAIELGTLAPPGVQTPRSAAEAINDAGVIVGFIAKYSGTTEVGSTAVRWESGSTEPTVMGNLGMSLTGAMDCRPLAINASGLAVGSATLYTNGTLVGSRAVLWKPDGSIVDLNSFLNAGSLFTLTYAKSISDSGWITGYARYDPDGPGATAAYSRLFLLDASAMLPEPSAAFVGAFALFACMRRR